MIKRKKIAKVIDPPRYPKVINGYESGFKVQYAIQLGKMVIDVTKKIVQLAKQ